MLLGLIDQAAQILGRDAMHGTSEQLDRPELAYARRSAIAALRRAAAERKLALGVGKLALELAPLIDDGGEPRDHLIGRDLEQLGRLAHPLVLGGKVAPRRLPGQGLDATDARGDRALAHDLEQSDIAGPPDMGAAAQLDGIRMAGLGALVAHAHADDADLIAVFLAEQSERAMGDRGLGRHQMRLDGLVLEDHGIDEILDRADLGMRHRLLMGEIESEAPGLDQRALLRHVGPQHLAERLVQEMGRRMVRAGCRAPRVVDLKLDGVADIERSLLDHALMEEETVQLLLRVLDLEDGILALHEPATVADLTAGLSVERGLVDDDDAALALFQRLDARAVLDESDDLP